MKKISYLGLFVVFISFLLISCKKEKINDLGNKKNRVSSYEQSLDAKYNKEIVVYDKKGLNSMQIAISCDDEAQLNHFIESHIFSTSKFNLEDLKQSADNNGENLDINKKEKDFQWVDDETPIFINILSADFRKESDVDYVSLAFELDTTIFQDKNYVYGYQVIFTHNSADVIGAVHRGHGYPFLTQWEIRQNWWNGWSFVILENNSNFDIIYPFGFYYGYVNYGLSNSSSNYRRMRIRPEIRQTGVNYMVYTSYNSGHTRDCALGNYNMNNYGECYYGSVPPGSSPFVWTYNSGARWFMYTPINGQCPWNPEGLPNPFDGANCKVVQIPSGINAYTWRRDLLIKSDLIH